MKKMAKFGRNRTSINLDENRSRTVNIKLELYKNKIVQLRKNIAKTVK